MSVTCFELTIRLRVSDKRREIYSNIINYSTLSLHLPQQIRSISTFHLSSFSVLVPMFVHDVRAVVPLTVVCSSCFRTDENENIKM